MGKELRSGGLLSCRGVAKVESHSEVIVCGVVPTQRRSKGPTDGVPN